MKRPISAVVLSLLTFALQMFLPDLLQGQERVFTNREGKTVRGTVKTVSNGIVQLEISDKIFEVPFQSLSDKDQAYLREWVVNNYPYRFDVRESDHRVTLDREPGSQPGQFYEGGSGQFRSFAISNMPGSRKAKHYGGYFKIVLANRSGITAENLKLKYRIVSVDVYSSRGYRGGNDRESTMLQEGSIDIPQIANTRSITLETGKVYLPDFKWETTDTIRLSDGDIDNKPTDHRKRCDLHGIMIRLFDSKGREIYSYVGPGKHMKKQRW